MMLWTGFGPHDEYLEAAMGYQSNLSSASYQSRGFNDPHLVVYMESHDEERMMYKNLQYGNGNGSYQVKDIETALDRVELANTFFYTIPGPKMLWQFGELGYDFSINTCENGTVDPGCRLSKKPIRWDYTEDPARIDVYNNMRALLHLRENYDVMHTTDFDLNVNQYTKTIHLNSADMNVTVLGNFDVVENSIDPEFQNTGTWYEYFTGEILEVSDVNAALTLQPGEFRLYTDEQVDPPAFVTADNEVIIHETAKWEIGPNPANDQSRVYLELAAPATVQFLVMDVNGKYIEVQEAELLPIGFHHFEIERLPAGMYFVQMKIDDSVETQKLIFTN